MVTLFVLKLYETPLNMNDNSKLQRELDKIMQEQGLFDKADRRYAAKLIERIVWGILTLFGLAIVASIIKVIGL